MWLHHAAVDDHLRRPLVVPPPLVTPPELLKAKALLSSIPIDGFRGAIKTSRKKQIRWRFVSPSFCSKQLLGWRICRKPPPLLSSVWPDLSPRHEALRNQRFCKGQQSWRMTFYILYGRHTWWKKSIIIFGWKILWIIWFWRITVNVVVIILTIFIMTYIYLLYPCSSSSSFNWSVLL